MIVCLFLSWGEKQTISFYFRCIQFWFITCQIRVSLKILISSHPPILQKEKKEASYVFSLDLACGRIVDWVSSSSQYS